VGLSWLVLPRGWRRWWWAFAPGLGLALQSAVVWLGVHTPVAGTNRYATWSELLPLALLGVAAWRERRAVAGWWRGGWGARGVLLLAVPAAWLLLWPMAQRGAWTLTSSSLGSCDHADYAAGARVFQEFSRDDRMGFLGLPEVTRVGTAENFFDYCVRLNHFTPSAVLAHNGAVLGLQPHQLVSLSGVVLVLLNAVLVLLLGRLALGLRGAAGLVPAAIYLVSPLGAYAVHHGALGQLYAAQGIALLTVAVLAAGRVRSPWPWSPVVLAALWLLAGSYNFILTVALAPAAGWLVLEAWRQKDWRGPARVLGMVLAMLVVCVVLFWGRFDGLVERFRLFEQYNFGWPVPLLSPEGWLGLLRDTGLYAWPRPVRMLLSGVVLAGWVAGVLWLWRRRRGAALAALALVLPVLGGWGVLVWEAKVRANASYDAFKLFSVFYPGLLAGLIGGLLVPVLDRGGWRRLVAGAAVLAVLGGNVWLALQFAREMARPPLRVDRTLLELRRLENMPRVTSLNLRIEQFWARLWANALLLRKPQYFPTHTYEARLNTTLRGEWDLSDSLLRSLPARERDYVEINAQFHAVRVGAPGLVGLRFGEGWHALEGPPAARWRWSSGPGRIVVTNSSGRPVVASLQVRVRPLQRCRFVVELDGRRLAPPRVLTAALQRLEYENVLLPPGESVLTLDTEEPPGRAEGVDERLLALALYELTFQALP
jgi:hypothetical protein